MEALIREIGERGRVKTTAGGAGARTISEAIPPTIPPSQLKTESLSAAAKLKLGGTALHATTGTSNSKTATARLPPQVETPPATPHEATRSSVTQHSWMEETPTLDSLRPVAGSSAASDGTALVNVRAFVELVDKLQARADTERRDAEAKAVQYLIPFFRGISA